MFEQFLLLEQGLTALHPFRVRTGHRGRQFVLKQLFLHRRLVWLLGLTCLRDRYTGTLGGMVWAVVNPLLLLLVFWVVFGAGLKLQADSGPPFVVVLFCGLIPWMTFNESLSGAAGSITARAYLVKKIAFPLEILPFTHILAAVLSHGVLLVILAGFLVWYSVIPGMGILLLPYYLLAMCALASGLGFLLAATAVFNRDVLQGLGVVLNIWFWVTPIVWRAEMLSPALEPMLYFNPLNYVVSGYRASLLSAEFTPPEVQVTLYFWAIVTLMWLLGTSIFLRLKNSFADVL